MKAAGTACVRTALFGPWQYDDGHSLGFDPLMERQHAFLGAKPERDSRRVPGAVLLAITALELVPLYPVYGRNGIANCLFRDGKWQQMSWPLWDTPLAVEAVGSLLTVSRVKGDRSLMLEIITAEFGSERKEVRTAGGSYPVLRQARRSA